MFGALGDIAGLMKQAREMKQKMEAMQEELARRVYEADAGAGSVNVRVSGRGEVLAVKVQPDAVNPADLESLEELIRAAVNAAMRKQQEAVQQEMQAMAGGMNLGGLGNLLGMKPGT